MMREKAAKWYPENRVHWLVFVITSAIAISKLLRHDTDFGIYWRAAEELAHTDLDVFRSHEDHGAYGYPHWVLLTFLPALSLPETIARIFFGLMQGLATVWIVVDVQRIVRRQVTVNAWHWLLFGLLFVRWITSNYQAGQLSLWVAALTIRGVAELDVGRSVRAGIMIGLAAAMKLTPLVFLVALPLMGFAGAALWMAGTVVAVVLILPWPVLGSSEHMRHLHEFYQAMLAPLFSHGHGDGAIWGATNLNISSTLHQLLQASPETGAIRTNLCELSDAAVSTVRQIYSSVLLAVGAIAFFRARGQRGAIVMQASIVTIMLSLFSPLTRSYHCSLLALAGMWFVASPCKGVGRRVARGVIATAFVLSMLLRQKSILGRDLWRALDHCGLVHFGIVGMLVLLACTPRVPTVVDPRLRE